MFNSLIIKKILPIVIVFALVLPIIFVFSLISKVWAQTSTSTNYKIQSSDINAGGTENQTSTNYRMSETIGGIATGISTSTLYSLKAGYRQMEDYYITLSSPSNVSLSPSISGMTGNLGTPSSGEVTWNVATDNPAGFSMSLKSSDSPALKLNSANYFSDYEPDASGTPDFEWSSPSSSEAYFGFTVEPETSEDTVQLFKDDGADCNAGGNNTADRCWFSFNGSSDITVINRTGRTDKNGEDEKIKLQAESNEKMLESGTYQTTITVTAVAN